MSQPSNGRGVLALCVMVCALALAAPRVLRAQEVFRARWVVQDPAHELEQGFAQRLIATVNDWLTRTQPQAPTARLDDPLRVTIAGVVGPDGVVRLQLREIDLGSIPLDSNFSAVLDSATIAMLIRRSHYWRDETIEIFNPAIAATVPWLSAGAPAVESPADAAWAAAETHHRIRAGLDGIELRLHDDLYLFLAPGHEDLALIGASAGRGRIGVGSGSLRLWGEVPLPLGTPDGMPLFARGLTGTLGAGASFEEFGLDAIFRGFGGMATVAINKALSGSDGDSLRYVLSRGAIGYGIIGAPSDLFGPVGVRFDIGVGYLDAEPVTDSDTPGAPSRIGGGTVVPLVRAEAAWRASNGSLGGIVSAGFLGGTFTASWQQQFSPTFGLRVATSVFGVIGGRDPWQPPVALLITPIIFID